MSVDPILTEAESKMDKSVDAFNRELGSIRTGRANPGLIEKLMVPYYDTPTPLNALASISAPEPRLLVVQVYDRSQIASVEKAIRQSELGLNPANDGQVIRVPIPPLTEERRKEFVKLVRQKAEDARVAVRNIRRDEIHRVEQMKKEGELAEDAVRRAESELQRITDHHVHVIDGVASRKEAEVMEV
ncbi:MAG TPA: ribosome recycling factor [Candidatus Dormibacteraeota bacterium]